MISGWPLDRGRTNGSGEYAHVIDPQNATPWTIFAQNCVTNEGLWGDLQVTASALFVGSPYTTVPAHLTSWGWSTGNYVNLDLLTNGTDAICFLTEIQGKFRGHGESVSVGTAWNGSVWEWYANTRQGTLGAGIGGNYGCMPYNTDH
jgi:hypothetical protein